MRFPTILREWRSKNEEAIHRRTNHQVDQGVRSRRQSRRYLPPASISTGTFYNWRSKCGGLEVNEARRLKDLESENNKLKKLLAEKLLEVDAMKDVISKKW